MKINVAARRRVGNLLSKVSDKNSKDLLESLDLDKNIHPEKRLSFLDEKNNGEWSTAKFRKVWSIAELSELFESWVNVHKTKKLKITLSELKKKLIHPDLKKDRIIALELIKKPKLFLFASTVNNAKSMNDKAATGLNIRDSVYWLPEFGIVLTNLHDDEFGEFLKKIFEKKVTGPWESYRFISLVISKYYNDNRMINKLVVNAMYQITGFQGLDEIVFKGEDVKAGLGGLHRRQDIRVHLDQIGPNIGVSTDNLDLKIGPKIRIKNLQGLKDLRGILFPKKK